VPRLKQTSLALLSIIDDEGVRERVCVELSGMEAQTIADRLDSTEATMVAAVAEAFELPGRTHVPIGDIAERFNAAVADDLGRTMTNKWVGSFLRRRLRLATSKIGGAYGISLTERPKVTALATRFGVTQSP
jgi:hypothetical protein